MAPAQMPSSSARWSVLHRPCGSRGGEKLIDDIDEVVPRDERDTFMAGYKAAAGFARDTLNDAAPTITPGQMAGA